MSWARRLSLPIGLLVALVALVTSAAIVHGEMALPARPDRSTGLPAGMRGPWKAAPRLDPARWQVGRPGPRSRFAGSYVAKRIGRAPAPAAAAPEPQVTPLDLPALLSRIGEFATTHGFPVRDFELGQTTDEYWTRTGHSGLSSLGKVFFPPATTSYLTEVGQLVGQRGRISEAYVPPLRTALHEVLHQMRFGRDLDVYLGPDKGYWEEAATGAVTQDLLPIMLLKMFGHRMSAPVGNARADAPPGGYSERITDLRQLSTYVTGSPNYNAYDARVWRRRFSHADLATRNAMLAAARASAAQAQAGG